MNKSTQETIARIKLENPALVAELTGLVEGAQANERLDMSVYDYFGDIGAEAANAHEDEDEQERALRSSENEASEVNNSGAEFQICIILDGHGVADGERLIRDLVGELTPKM